MKRLAVPILIVLLMLLAGAVWALFVHLDLPQFAGPPSQPATISEQQAAPEKSASGRAEAPATGEEQASFDIARIDPQGTSVFAGRAEPGSTVTIMGDGKAIGTAEVDANGEWTFATEHPFASAEPKLALTVKSAAETKAEADARAKVAGNLETREAAPQPPQAQPPKSEPGKKVTAELLKDFEGIVAAARTEAQEEKAREEKKAEEQPAKVPEPSVTKVEDEKAAAPEPKQEAAPEPGQQTPEPKQQAAVVPETPPAVAMSEAKPSAPPMRLAAPAAEPQAERKSIPVPITFVYNEANFTDDGRKAAALLLEYLQLKHFARVSLTGHADERGTPEFNMGLSRERLDTVAQFLKEGGFKGELELVPKGETEPFSGVVRSQYPRDDLYQFDRRVELIIAP